MKPRKIFVTSCLLILSITMMNAQKKLILTKIGTRKKTVFYEGESIRLKVKGADNYVGGPIIGLRDSVIHFRNFDIDLDSISEIDIRQKHMGGFNIGQYGPSLVVAGIIFLGADWLNQGDLSGDSALISGALVGSGLIMIYSRPKRFKIKGRNKIAIID